MKKYLLLLFVSAITFAQNPTRFAKVQITGNSTSSTAANVNVQESNGEVNTKPLSDFITEQRVAVNDANYTVSTAGSLLISFTALTATRTLNLPPAIIANQRIRIVDESFTCSGLKKILIIPNGSDLVSGGINSVINFPGGSAYFESNGAGKWATLSTTSIQLSAGVNTLPTITDNGNGTVTIGNDGVYTMFANPDGSGRPKSYSVNGGTYTMVDGSLNYIIAKYDSTTSTTSVVTSVNEADINSFSSIKVFAIYRQGTVLFIRDNDKLGLALSNKLQRNAEQTNNIRVNNGTILLSESATRIVNVSAGTAWIGGNEIPLAAVSSSTSNTMFFVTQTSFGVWNTSTFAPSGQYSNTQYNDPNTGVQTLGNGKYGVIFVFRSLGQGNKLAYVLGQGNYTLGDAQVSKRPTNLPSIITSQMIPVGRIIILKGDSVATQIDKISDENYAFSGVTDHEALSSLLGGDSSGHYHVTTTEKATWNGKVSGTGTLNYIPKWSSTSGLTNAGVYDFGNGNIGVNTTTDSGASLQLDKADGGNIGLKYGGVDDWAFGQSSGIGNSRNFNIYNYNTGGVNFYISRNNGNVGIGTTTDNGVDKLQVNGSIRSNGPMKSTSSSTTPAGATMSDVGLYLVNGGSTTLYNGIGFQGAYTTDMYFGKTTDADDLVIRDGSTERVRFKSNGNVGIGTTTPSTTLDVNGTASFSGVVTAPTATAGTNTTQIATTAFVSANAVTLNTTQTITAQKIFTNTASFQTSGALPSIVAYGTGNSIIANIQAAGSATGDALIVENIGSATTNLIRGRDTSGATVFNVSANGSTTVKSLIASNGTIRLKGYTVATLPTGVVGDTAYVTDATAPTFLVAVVGGGAIVTPVFYNGTAWISH